MAEQQDLDYTYSTIDKIFRISMGETGDFSGAMYNGDFSLSLEEAQNMSLLRTASTSKKEVGYLI